MGTDPDTGLPPVIIAGYDWPDLNLSRCEARRWFCYAVQRVEPAVLETLADEPYTLFLRVSADMAPVWTQEIQNILVTKVLTRTEHTSNVAQHPFFQTAVAWLRAWADYLPVRTPEHMEYLYRWMPFTPPGTPHPPKVRRLQESVRDWAAEWHLTPDWCADYALWTLGHWRRQEKLRRERDLPPLPPREFGRSYGWDWVFPECYTHRRVPINYDEQRFDFSAEGWTVIKTTRAEAEQALRAEFDAALARYLDRMEQLAEARGLVPAPQRRSHEHFAWLAQYQLRGRSYREIAEEACRDRKTIADAVRDIAALIELPLRPTGRPGRPRKFPVSRAPAECRI